MNGFIISLLLLLREMAALPETLLPAPGPALGLQRDIIGAARRISLSRARGTPIKGRTPVADALAIAPRLPRAAAGDPTVGIRCQSRLSIAPITAGRRFARTRMPSAGRAPRRPARGLARG